MAKSDPAAQKRERKKALRWVVTVFVVTMIVSGTISLVSDMVMERSSMAVAFLILGDKYYVMNVGDSRAYMLSDAIYQLTKDQTYVQYEMDMGHMTWEQAQTHPQRNVLLQCIGASEVIKPDYFVGDVEPDMTFILCSDGFRHVISPDEIYEKLRPDILDNEEVMLQNARDLVEMNKSRKEVDNISVAVIRTCREE